MKQIQFHGFGNSPMIHKGNIVKTSIIIKEENEIETLKGTINSINAKN